MGLHRGWKFPVLAVALLVGACSEVANTPTSPTTFDIHIPKRPLGDLSWIDGNIISIVDDATGVSYSYNADAQTLTRSDGVVVLLSESQAAETINQFLNVYDADRTFVDFGAVCTPENPCPEPMLAEPGTFGDGGQPLSSIVIGLDSAHETIKNNGRHFGITVSLPKELTKTSKKPKGSIPAYFDGYCGDLVTALNGSRISWGNTRTGWVKAVFTAAVGEGIQTFGGWVLGAGIWSSSVILTAGVEAVTENVQTKILGTLWNSHECSQRNVYVGRIFSSGGPTSGVLHCDRTSGWITFDGSHYYLISYDNCYYSQT